MIHDVNGKILLILLTSYIFCFKLLVEIVFFFFFFQAEDGIRDLTVTGVQTCALPIFHLVTGKRLAWDKTMHDFPSTDQLSHQRQRLGELLLSWQAIDETRLATALEIQIGRASCRERV